MAPENTVSQTVGEFPGGEEPSQRLDALRRAWDRNTDGIQDTQGSLEVNNHVHTRYSFSPYSPSGAAWCARQAGLMAVGSVDHESIGAAEEMMAAGAVLGIGTTVGVEIRVSWADTPFADRRLNNPDTIGNAYIVLHGVPASAFSAVADFLAPLVRARRERNGRQVERLNAILAARDLPVLDYQRDVEPLSWVHRGGTVTERHILYALAGKLTAAFPNREELVRTISDRLSIELAERQVALLQDPDNPHFLYDLLGVFKGYLVDAFFLQPDMQECPPLRVVNDFAREIGAIPAYSYLGDVGESPTGDKKAQQFEDDFLDELFEWIPRLGYQAVTYMPPRNTLDQLVRVQEHCRAQGLLEISGVDINSSRQSFTCPEVLQKEFRHLNDTTWALIAHEKLAAQNPRFGFFHQDNPLATLPLNERVMLYSEAGQTCDAHHPEGMEFPHTQS